MGVSLDFRVPLVVFDQCSGRPLRALVEYDQWHPRVNRYGQTKIALVRQAGGEIVLARPGLRVVEYVEEMRMDDYWDAAGTDEEAKSLMARP